MSRESADGGHGAADDEEVTFHEAVPLAATYHHADWCTYVHTSAGAASHDGSILFKVAGNSVNLMMEVATVLISLVQLHA